MDTHNRGGGQRKRGGRGLDGEGLKGGENETSAIVPTEKKRNIFFIYL